MSAVERPLRVLHLLNELRPSGAEVMLGAAAPLFRAEGVDAEILAMAPDQLGPYAGILADAGYPIHHIPFHRDPLSFLRIAKFMRGGRYDVIHIHTESSNLYLGIAALVSARRKTLRTVHNAFEFDGWLRVKRKLHRRIVHHLGLVHVAISPSVRETERERFANPTVLVNNWFDTERFRPPLDDERREARAALQLAEDQFVVASVGNCSVVKNHSAIIEAIALMPPERHPVYLHVGIEEPGEPERRHAERLGVDKWVEFLGARSDIDRILRAADAFVMPSLVEGFAVAAVEALAMRLPCIFTDCPGLLDFQKIFPGIVRVAPDAGSVQRGLERVMSMSREEREALTAGYHKLACERYGIYQGVRGYVEVYRGRVTPT